MVMIQREEDPQQDMHSHMLGVQSFTDPRLNAQSSTEAEFIAAVTAAKTAIYLRSVLNELGFQQDEPTPIYEDNASAIEIINAQKPTERSRHIEI